MALDQSCSDLSLDVRLDIPISNTTTFHLHTMLTAVTGFQRDEGTWDHIIEATSL